MGVEVCGTCQEDRARWTFCDDDPVAPSVWMWCDDCVQYERKHDWSERIRPIAIDVEGVPVE